jgi:tetratricopeptide (TPR) repeat protein
MFWANHAADANLRSKLNVLPQEFLQIKDVHLSSPQDVLHAHEFVAKSQDFTNSDLEKALQIYEHDAWPHLINGFRREESGDVDQAIDAYRKAAERSLKGDWQAFFRLALVHAERKELPLARGYAERIIEEYPSFAYREQLERLISETKI